VGGALAAWQLSRKLTAPGGAAILVTAAQAQPGFYRLTLDGSDLSLTPPAPENALPAAVPPVHIVLLSHVTR